MAALMICGLVVFFVSIFNITLIPLNYTANPAFPDNYFLFAPFMVFIPMVVLFVCMFGGAFYNMRAIRTTWQQLDQIGNRYRAPETYHFPASPWNAPKAGPISPMGSPVVPKFPPLEQPNPQAQFCPHCGSRVPPGAKYCPACGDSMH
jgi:ribosomal protein L40E